MIHKNRYVQQDIKKTNTFKFQLAKHTSNIPILKNPRFPPRENHHSIDSPILHFKTHTHIDRRIINSNNRVHDSTTDQTHRSVAFAVIALISHGATFVHDTYSLSSGTWTRVVVYRAAGVSRACYCAPSGTSYLPP